MKWKLVIGTALSAFFLWLAFRKANLHDVAAALAGARYILLLPILAATLLAFALRALRWRFLLSSIRSVPFVPLFSATMIGFMGNNLLPARLGEIMRADSLGRNTGVSRSAALASIVVERIFDMSVLLLLFGLIVLLAGLPPDVRIWGRALLLVTVPVLAGLLLFQARPGPVAAMVARIAPARFRGRALVMAENFHSGLGGLGRAGTVFGALAASLAMWGSLTAVVALCFSAIRLTVQPAAAVVVLVLMAVGTMIPSAPGYLGTLQYAGTLALLQYGVDRSVALSFTLLYHASQWIPVTLIGLAFFLRQHFRGNLGHGRIREELDGQADRPIRKEATEASGRHARPSAGRKQ